MITRFQQGGSMNDDKQQKIMQLLVAYLAHKTGAKDQKSIEATLQKLGQDGISKILDSDDFKQFAQVQSARNGAKLQARCPQGMKLVLFKKGGVTGCGCKKGEEGLKVPSKKQINPNDTIQTKQGTYATGNKPVTDPRTGKTYQPTTKSQYQKLPLDKKRDMSIKTDQEDKCGGKIKKLKKNKNGGILIPDSFRQLFK